MAGVKEVEEKVEVDLVEDMGSFDSFVLYLEDNSTLHTLKVVL